MTPMIDVIFLLLVFFICASAGHLRELLLPTDFAAGAVESPEPLEPETPLGKVWVRLRHAEGRTIASVEGTDFTAFAPLERQLRSVAELAPEVPVILDIMPNVPVGDLIRVYDVCRAAGFESVHFATDPQRVGKPR